VAISAGDHHYVFDYIDLWGTISIDTNIFSVIPYLVAAYYSYVDRHECTSRTLKLVKVYLSSYSVLFLFCLIFPCILLLLFFLSFCGPTSCFRSCSGSFFCYRNTVDKDHNLTLNCSAL